MDGEPRKNLYVYIGLPHNVAALIGDKACAINLASTEDESWTLLKADPTVLTEYSYARIITVPLDVMMRFIDNESRRYEKEVPKKRRRGDGGVDKEGEKV